MEEEEEKEDVEEEGGGGENEAEENQMVSLRFPWNLWRPSYLFHYKCET